jgi:hypothetical protein
MAGQHDQLVRVIQVRYRYLRERTQDEADQRLQAYQAGGSPMAEAMIAAADEAASRLPGTAEEGRAPAAGTSLLGQYIGELVALVRRYPVTSVLIGLGVGVLLARSLGRTRSSWGVSPANILVSLPFCMV